MKQKRTNKRRPIIIAIIALLLIGVGVVYATRPKSAPKEATKTEDAKKAEAEVAKADELEKPSQETNSSGDTAATAAAKFAIVINRPVNGDTIPLDEGIAFRSMITGASTGSCTLTLTGPSGQKVTKTANFEPQSSYASCNIDIASNQLTKGSWQMSLVAKSGSSTSSPITQKVTVQ